MQLNNIKNFVVSFLDEHFIIGGILIGLFCIILFLSSIRSGTTYW